LLSYLEYELPVLAATDINTDLGKIIQENGIGLWSVAGDLSAIDKNVNKLAQDFALRKKMGQNGLALFHNNYTVDKSYNIIVRHCDKNT